MKKHTRWRIKAIWFSTPRTVLTNQSKVWTQTNAFLYLLQIMRTSNICVKYMKLCSKVPHPNNQTHYDVGWPQTRGLPKSSTHWVCNSNLETWRILYRNIILINTFLMACLYHGPKSFDSSLNLRWHKYLQIPVFQTWSQQNNYCQLKTF